MKIISGSLKGRTIKGYNIEGTRPTMDRVKESVFASVQTNIPNSLVLDLFAGSGNLGIESLSNGAKECYFVDNNPQVIKILKENIQNFNLTDQSHILLSDYQKAIKNFQKEDLKFDLVFVDPPYKYQIINEVIDLVLVNKLLAPNGLLILEYQSDKLKDNFSNLELIKSKKYGDKKISIYKYTSALN